MAPSRTLAAIAKIAGAAAREARAAHRLRGGAPGSRRDGGTSGGARRRAMWRAARAKFDPTALRAGTNDVTAALPLAFTGGGALAALAARRRDREMAL